MGLWSAERAFTEQSKSLLTNASNSQKQWSTVKATVFSASLNLLPLGDRRGKLVWSAEEKASLFSAHFDAKQNRDSFQQPQACDPSPVICFVAFRPNFICNLLLDLDSYCKNDFDGMFPLFLQAGSHGPGT